MFLSKKRIFVILKKNCNSIFFQVRKKSLIKMSLNVVIIIRTFKVAHSSWKIYFWLFPIQFRLVEASPLNNNNNTMEKYATWLVWDGKTCILPILAIQLKENWGIDINIAISSDSDINYWAKKSTICEWLSIFRSLQFFLRNMFNW